MNNNELGLRMYGLKEEIKYCQCIIIRHVIKGNALNVDYALISKLYDGCLQKYIRHDYGVNFIHVSNWLFETLMFDETQLVYRV